MIFKKTNNVLTFSLITSGNYKEYNFAKSTHENSFLWNVTFM